MNGRATRTQARKQVIELRQNRLSSNQWTLLIGRPSLRTGTGPLTDKLEEINWLLCPFDHFCGHPGHVEKPTGVRDNIGGQHDGSGIAQLFHPRSEMHGLAYSIVVSRMLAFQRTNDGLAGMQPDPDLCRR